MHLEPNTDACPIRLLCCGLGLFELYMEGLGVELNNQALLHSASPRQKSAEEHVQQAMEQKASLFGKEKKEKSMPRGISTMP